MQRKIILLVMCVCLALLVQAQKKTHPNLLVILVDQWRGQALGLEGKEPVYTPNLDAMAGQGLVLGQMVSNYPVCSPARAMVMTGKYPLKNHVYSNVNSASAPHGIELPAHMVCWPDVLKTNGYANGYIGKWHLDSPHPPYIPTYNNTDKIAWNEWTAPDRRHGFDYWYAYGTYDMHNHPMYWDTHAVRDSFHYVNEWGPVHETDKALAFIRNEHQAFRNSGQPFSLVVSMNPPHSEYATVPQRYYARYANIPLDSFLHDPDIPAAGTSMGEEYRKNIRYYYASMTGIDEQVGRMLQGLKDAHLDSNTIVVFMSDHGNCLGKHDEVSKNNLYEASLRIPFIIRWQGHILPRTDSTFLCSLPDLYPTLLGLMGLEKAVPDDLDGKSYAAYFLNGKGSGASEQFILGGINSNMVKVNSGFRGIRTQQYKLAYVNKGDKQQAFLYNIQNDPFELHNLYTAEDKEVVALKEKLKQWLLKTKDGFVIQ